MFLNKEFYKLLDNEKFNIPAFIYSFKHKKITKANDAIARLFGFESKELFSAHMHDKLYNVCTAKGIKKIDEMYKRGNLDYSFNISFFNNLNKKIHSLCNVNQFDNTNIIVLMYDLTNKINEQNQIEASYLNSILDKNAIIRGLAYNFETIIKIDMDDFTSSIIEIEGEEVKEKEIQASWESYTNFLLSLININDAKRIRPLFSKENLKDFSNSKKHFRTEKFESNFTISNASMAKETLEYEIVFVSVSLNEKNYVFILIKLINDNIYDSDLNIISQVSSEYLSIFKINSENKILIVRANKKFEEFFNTYWLNNDFSEAIKLYSNRFVSNVDKQKFIEMTKLDNISHALKNNKFYHVPFERIYNNTVEKVEFLFFKTILGDKEELTLAIKTLESEQPIYKIDSMTDLYTYSAFLSVIEERLKTNLKGYIIYFNIKNFDKYNKYFSTLAGDKILMKLGNIIHRLKQDYDIVGAHIAREEFVLYINIEENRLDDFIMFLLERIQVTSQYFDFIIDCGVINVEDEIFDISLMVEDAIYASRNTKEIVNQNYFFFNKNMKNEIEYDKSEMDFIIKSIKDNDIYSYFRPIYKNNVVVAYDYNIRTRELFRNHNRSLYPFLEKNGLSFNVNLNSVNKILEIASNSKKTFIVYLTKQFLENKKELHSLIEKINDLNLNDRIILSIGSNNIDNTLDETLKSYFRVNNIKYMFDYTNCNTFNFTSIIKFKPDYIKLDLKLYNDLGDYGLKLLHAVSTIIRDNNIKLYFANINYYDDMNLLDDLYTLKGDKTVQENEIYD